MQVYMCLQTHYHPFVSACFHRKDFGTLYDFELQLTIVLSRKLGEELKTNPSISQLFNSLSAL